MMRGLAAVVASIGLFASAAAADGIEIDEPWVRASLGRVPNSAAYMVIRSDAPDRLIGASSPAAERVELHNQMEHAGVQQMRRIEALPLGPDQPATLQPGGLHLMLMGLKDRLVEGDTVALELTFERAGTVEVEALIRGLMGGSAGSHGAGGHHGAGHQPDG